MTAYENRRLVTLVVGTTPDYIEWIRQKAPGRALFLTDPILRQEAKEPPPGAGEELLCNLADEPGTATRLAEHLKRWDFALEGVTAFDCESLELAAILAEAYALPYPSPGAVALCRDKSRSKERWRAAGLRCPEAAGVDSPEAAAAFRKALGGPVVLKPRTGSGSEQVWLCPTAQACRIRYRGIAAALETKGDDRLYHSLSLPGSAADPPIVAEAFIDGPEYSCDFIIEGGSVETLRLTEKIGAGVGPFGTTQGYLLRETPPAGIGREAFLATLEKSASALGIGRGICMLDFMVQKGEMVLLEMAPRPGGDCLPPLLLRATGLDILSFALDFAARRTSFPPPGRGFTPGFLGIRLLARKGGILKRIDRAALAGDPRVLEIVLRSTPGRRIVLPPEDYDSWVLGHLIARIAPGSDPRETLREIADRIETVMEG